MNVMRETYLFQNTCGKIQLYNFWEGVCVKERAVKSSYKKFYSWPFLGPLYLRQRLLITNDSYY